MNISKVVEAVLASLMVLSCRGHAASVEFDRSVYTVSTHTAIPVRVQMDPVDAAGLYSYGVRLTFTPIVGVSVTVVPLPVLDFNGVLGPGAVMDTGPGFAAVKGTAESVAAPSTNPFLATFLMEFSQPGDYPLGLELFNTLGPTEEIFVNGSGLHLDPDIMFGSAVVHVTSPPGGGAIPEPADALLVLVGGLICVLWRRLCRGCSRDTSSPVASAASLSVPVFD